MVSQFSLFITTTTTKIVKTTPPWPNTHHLISPPPLYSQIQMKYVSERFSNKEHEYPSHSEKGVSLNSFLTLTNITNLRPWRSLPPPLTLIQLSFFFSFNTWICFYFTMSGSHEPILRKNSKFRPFYSCDHFLIFTLMRSHSQSTHLWFSSTWIPLFLSGNTYLMVRGYRQKLYPSLLRKWTCMTCFKR